MIHFEMPMMNEKWKELDEAKTFCSTTTDCIIDIIV